MIALEHPDFAGAYRELSARLAAALRVENSRWQGVDVSKDLGGVEDLDHWRRDCGPNLPWADDHFLERVGGEPLNPGREWANWPWSRSADRFRRNDERFNHSYMERLWPRFARMTERGELADDQLPALGEGRVGVDRRYGDLDDLVDLLVRDPYTRQAFIPLFHPEDTGWGDGGRKMCSLGYQFLRRGDSLGVFYPMRSCDLVRHLRDDCYLAVRLLLWVLDRCRGADLAKWSGCRPGSYAMWMTSLHCFENDRRLLAKELSDGR